MSKKGRTKDEFFLLKLHELASKLGDYTMPLDRFEIGRAIGQNDKGANVIARDLAQANFVRKAEGDAVYLTEHGLHLVESLLKG
jgi:hypothetical protein